MACYNVNLVFWTKTLIRHVRAGSVEEAEEIASATFHEPDNDIVDSGIESVSVELEDE